MQFNLGLVGLGLLIAMSLGFGVIAQLIVGFARTRWMWLIAAAGYGVGGLFTSEVLFASATIEELQPIIDGLMLDESLLGGFILGTGIAVLTWYVMRRTGHHRPTSA